MRIGILFHKTFSRFSSSADLVVAVAAVEVEVEVVAASNSLTGADRVTIKEEEVEARIFITLQ